MIRAIKSRRMRLAGHMARMGRDKKCLHVRIILEWIIGKWSEKVWTEFIWLRIGTSGWFL